ncbi:MAG: hypothetical protein ACI3YK_04320 [Eubacteriales bacterium]
MAQLIYSLFLLLICTLGFYLGTRKAKQMTLSGSLARFLLVLLAALPGIFLSSLIAWLLAGALVGIPMGIIPLLQTVREDITVITDILRAIIASILSPVLFWLFYPVCRKLILLLTKPLTRLFDRIACRIRRKKPVSEGSGNGMETVGTPTETADNRTEFNEKRTVWERLEGVLRTVLCGGCGLFFAVALLTPVAGLVRTAGFFISPMTIFYSAERSEIGKITTLADDLASSPGSTVVCFIGEGPLYAGLTSYPVGDGIMTLSTEASACKDFTRYVKKGASEDKSVSESSFAIRHSRLVTGVLPDALVTAAEKWDEQKPFCGVYLPKFKTYIQPIVDVAVSSIGSMDPDDLGDDMLSLVNAAAYALAHEGSLLDYKALFTDERSMTGVFESLLSATDLHPTLNNALDTASRTIFANLNSSDWVDPYPLPKSQRLRKKEAQAYAELVANAMNYYTAFSQSSLGNVSTAMGYLGGMMDAMAKTTVLGDDEQMLLCLKTALYTNYLRNRFGYSDLELENLYQTLRQSILQDGCSYTEILTTLGNVMDLVSLAISNDPDAGSAVIMRAEELIDNLTVGSSRAISSILTTGTVGRFGLSYTRSEAVCDLMDYLMDNLLTEKETGLTESRKRAEAQALSDLIRVSVSGSGSLFGVNGKLGKSETEYVETILDSSAVSKAIVEVAMEKGIDPLGVSGVVSADSKRSLTDALMEKCGDIRHSDLTDVEKAGQITVLTSIGMLSGLDAGMITEITE